MTCAAEIHAFHARLADRWGWRIVPASLVFWTVLWPLGLLALAGWLIRRHLALDKTRGAKTERRVARLLRWYPGDWRARYGDELAALLHDTIADGRGGVRLWLDVARAGLGTRITATGATGVTAVACWSLCWLPLFPQGLVALAMKLAESPDRSWFLALHLPEAYQWPAIAGMIALGLLMLGAAWRASIARYGTPLLPG